MNFLGRSWKINQIFPYKLLRA